MGNAAAPKAPNLAAPGLRQLKSVSAFAKKLVKLGSHAQSASPERRTGFSVTASCTPSCATTPALPCLMSQFPSQYLSRKTWTIFDFSAAILNSDGSHDKTTSAAPKSAPTMRIRAVQGGVGDVQGQASAAARRVCMRGGGRGGANPAAGLPSSA